MSFLRRNWRWVAPGAVVLVAFLAWLAFGYFAVQTLFVDDVVDEAGPVFDRDVAAAAESPADTTAAAAPDTTAVTETTAAPVSTTAAPLEILTLAEGSFIDRAHATSGTAVVLNDGTEQRFLRFEDFETENGPDLNVYLSSAPPDAPDGDLDADYVDLGDLKGNIGDQNYEIPPGVDLDRYSTVVIWCVRFTVAFGAAELA
jgi:Electron transfer DM13